MSPSNITKTGGLSSFLKPSDVQNPPKKGHPSQTLSFCHTKVCQVEFEHHRTCICMATTLGKSDPQKNHPKSGFPANIISCDLHQEFFGNILRVSTPQKKHSIPSQRNGAFRKKTWSPSFVRHLKTLGQLSARAQLFL